MNHRFSCHVIALRLGAIAVVIFCGCIPLTRQTARSAAFPAMNEKIFLYPVIDSTSLEQFEGWPTDKPIQDILLLHFRKLDAALLFNFRQHEKYGLYEMVEDSLLSSVRVSFVIGKFAFSKDVLAFPVRMTIRRYTDNLTRSFSCEATGIYRAKSLPKSPVHYLDILLGDFRRHFPYDKMSGVFYLKDGKGNAFQTTAVRGDSAQAVPAHPEKERKK
jgi:hypothetical protein